MTQSMKLEGKEFFPSGMVKNETLCRGKAMAVFPAAAGFIWFHA